ncbi:MAG TPA: alpha/beta fold hydrolase [Candidatus Limnocylindrales bacterium]
MIAVCAVLGFGASAGAVPAQAKGQTGAPGRVAPIAWAPCAEDRAVQCGAVKVPLDWGHARGAQIEVAVARRPAKDPAARIGVLLFNLGGPNGSGVDDLLADGFFSASLRQRFDLIGFDARGTGRSHPVLCSGRLVAQRPPDVRTSAAEFDRLAAYNRALREDCRRRTGPLYDHVDTVSVAHDLDRIRAALGEDTISFYGLSYGSLLGQDYAALFPRRLRALVLDSVLHHRLDTRSFVDTAAANAQDSFDEFVAWCGRDAGCALHARDVRVVWHGLLARAALGEIPYPPDPSRPIRPEELINAALGAFHGPDWATVAQILAALDSGVPIPAPPAPPVTEVIAEPSAAIRCHDWNLRAASYPEYAAHQRRAAVIAPDLELGPAAGWLGECLGIPAPAPSRDSDARPGFGGPVLLVNALHDPATGIDWASSVAGRLGPAAVLLTYEGWGHVVYGRGECTTGAVDTFLTALIQPAAGSRCPAAGIGTT